MLKISQMSSDDRQPNDCFLRSFKNSHSRDLCHFSRIAQILTNSDAFFGQKFVVNKQYFILFAQLTDSLSSEYQSKRLRIILAESASTSLGIYFPKFFSEIFVLLRHERNFYIVSDDTLLHFLMMQNRKLEIIKF